MNRGLLAMKMVRRGCTSKQIKNSCHSSSLAAIAKKILNDSNFNQMAVITRNEDMGNSEIVKRFKISKGIASKIGYIARSKADLELMADVRPTEITPKLAITKKSYISVGMLNPAEKDGKTYQAACIDLLKALGMNRKVELVPLLNGAIEVRESQ